MGGRLRRALDGGVVTSAFQPIVDLRRACIAGFEALARFDDPHERNPERRFEAARRTGCAAKLEALAVRSALEHHDDLPTNCFLTVDVSPELLGSPEIRSVWREHGALGGVVVELTEQARVDSYAALDGDLAALRAAGALIAVDDAGAGYAGLRHLLALRPSTLVDLGVPLAQGYLLGRSGPPWPTLDLDVAAELLAAKPRHSDPRSVRDLVEPVPATGDVAQAAAWFGGGADQVVLVDEIWRPLVCYSPDIAVLGADVAAVRVNADTPVADALLRALTRELPQRWEPLLCTDSAGRLLGLLRVEDLARSAAAVAVP